MSIRSSRPVEAIVTIVSHFQSNQNFTIYYAKTERKQLNTSTHFQRIVKFFLSYVRLNIKCNFSDVTKGSVRNDVTLARAQTQWMPKFEIRKLCCEDMNITKEK